jgi:replicative DNA helicase
MKEIDIHLDKLPPQNIEAEQSILGAILIDNDALPKTLEILDTEDFYKLSHKKIFSSMTDLFDKNEPIDLITLTDHLRKKEELEQVGGLSYLSTLVNITPTAANIRYHARIVRAKGLMRGLLRSAHDISNKIYEDNLERYDYRCAVGFQ